MYEPLFNTVLVEIDDSEAKWGTGNDDSTLGKSYRFGTVVTFGQFLPTADYPVWKGIPSDKALIVIISELEGKQIMWNEGVEAGTVHEHDGKQYAFIYWWDIRGGKQ